MKLKVGSKTKSKVDSRGIMKTDENQKLLLLMSMWESSSPEAKGICIIKYLKDELWLFERSIKGCPGEENKETKEMIKALKLLLGWVGDCTCNEELVETVR